MKLKQSLKNEKFQKLIFRKQDEKLKNAQRASIKLTRKWKRSRLSFDRNEKRLKDLSKKLII